MALISVLLPAPLGPTMPTRRGSCSVQVDVPQHRLAVVGDRHVVDIKNCFDEGILRLLKPETGISKSETNPNIE